MYHVKTTRKTWLALLGLITALAGVLAWGETESFEINSELTQELHTALMGDVKRNPPSPAMESAFLNLISATVVGQDGLLKLRKESLPTWLDQGQIETIENVLDQKNIHIQNTIGYVTSVSDLLLAMKTYSGPKYYMRLPEEELASAAASGDTLVLE